MRKILLITGASSGIGKAMADYLAVKGHLIIGTSRSPDQEHGGNGLVRLDVGSESSVKEAVELALARYGTIDVLINNAGFGLCGPLEDTSIEEAKRQFEVNYFGVVRVTNQILPHFRARRQGLIINISSMAGLIGMPFQGHYSASKFALEGYTEALRMELRPFNVGVCNINPGDFRTDFSANRKQAQCVGEAYRDRFEDFMALYEAEERHGADPLLIARQVEKLIHRKKRFPVRVLVGKPSQTIGARVKRLLGDRLFERIMMRIWKV